MAAGMLSDRPSDFEHVIASQGAIPVPQLLARLLGKRTKLSHCRKKTARQYCKYASMEESLT
jgi:ribosomal protein L1